MWWNSETLPWKSGTVMVEKCGTVMVGQWNSKVVQCGGTVEKTWWNSVVEKWNSHGGTEEQSWWNSGRLIMEQCDETVEQ